MTIQNNGRVFITDGVIRRSLAATRALGSQGIHVTCGEATRANMTFWSRYCSDTHTYPLPSENPEAFINNMATYLEQHPHECLFPMEQDTLDIMLKNRSTFDSLTRLPFVDYATYRVFRDKAETMKLAAKIGIPHPRTIYITDLDQLEAAVKGLDFPMIIKPRGNWATLGVRVASNMAELKKTYAEIHADFPFPLIQEKIPPGEQYNVNCLLDENSKLKAVCTQFEPRHHPYFEGMGPSTVQQSVDRPDLVDITVQLLQANNWYGVANADIIIDPRDNTPRLLEINPRFWGTLQASINSGVNFPHLLYRMARGEKIEPVLTYKLGVTTRALLPYDILHFISNPDRMHLKPSFFNFWGKDVCYDIISRHDLKPLIGFALTVGRYLFNPEVWTRLAHMERFGAFLAKITGQKKHSSQRRLGLKDEEGK